MEKLEMHYVSNSGFTSDTKVERSVHAKEIIVFYFYFEWVL